MASSDFASVPSCVIVFFGKIIPNEALKKPTVMGGLPRKNREGSSDGGGEDRRDQRKQEVQWMAQALMHRPLAPQG